MKKISKNAMIKIISFVFALFLWSYVRSEVDPERTVTYKDVDVRFENLAEIKDHNLAIVSNTDVKVDVTVSGKTSDMGRMNRDNISATVDLSGYSEGETSIPIKISVDNNENIRVLKREPSRVSVKIDEVLEKEMDVAINLNGQLKDTYTLGNVKASESVKVTAASSILDSIDKLSSEVNVDGMSESSIKTGSVLAYDKDGNVINSVSISPSTIDIEVPVLKTLTVPVRLNVTGMEESEQFYVEPNSIMIKGNSAVVNKITEISTQQISAQRLRGNRVEASLVLPDGVTLVDKDLKVVASSEEIVPNRETFSYKSSDFKILNLEDMEVEFLTTGLDIECVQKNLLEDYSLKKEDITISLDFKNLELGEHELSPVISVPAQYKLEKSTPDKIKVSIKKKGIF